MLGVHGGDVTIREWRQQITNELRLRCADAQLRATPAQAVVSREVMWHESPRGLVGSYRAPASQLLNVMGNRREQVRPERLLNLRIPE
jgi:hypothetical protein